MRCIDLNANHSHLQVLDIQKTTTYTKKFKGLDILGVMKIIPKISSQLKLLLKIIK
jgi:hypothetical protein